MLPNIRTILAAVLVTFMLAAGTLALISSRMPIGATMRTPGTGERASLELSAAEPAELRGQAAARRNEELSRLLAIQIGPAGASARESEFVPPPRRSTAAGPLPQPEELAALPAIEVASLHAPEVRPESVGDEVETHFVAPEWPATTEPDTDERSAGQPDDRAGQMHAAQRPGAQRAGVRLPTPRVSSTRKRARIRPPRQTRAKAAVQAQPRVNRRVARKRKAPAQRAGQPQAINPYQSQYEGWPADAFLPQQQTQTRQPTRSRARSSEPQ